MSVKYLSKKEIDIDDAVNKRNLLHKIFCELQKQTRILISEIEEDKKQS